MMELDFESGINSLNVGTVNSDMNDLLESKSRESDSVDDLLGSHVVNSGVKEESKGAEFEDLIPGFGGASSLNVKSICPRTYMMELDFESGINSLNVGTVNSDMNDLLESKSRVSDSVDDLVGSHGVNSGVKEESKGAEFEDLIPGFRGASSLNVKGHSAALMSLLFYPKCPCFLNIMSVSPLSELGLLTLAFFRYYAPITSYGSLRPISKPV
ncbi:hypothetical protein BUALT_Bualt12G0109200 [Buddleja alternifolia]|uniref:Uncharacterized protein n=1 Tax=Buddleja alternifolia TaxID=168488 RepID=A0AAV6WYB6_9LAMI|nr:hypothetical protein BUALT_Bualt12G0109200 [Buddleja alternifolia]